MTQMEMDEAAGLIGRGLHDRTGATIGTVDAVLAGADAGHAAWLSVALATGGRAAVPLIDLVIDEHVRVPYAGHQIAEAPQVPEGGIDAHTDRALRGWYGLAAAPEPDDPSAGSLLHRDPSAQGQAPFGHSVLE